ncbi:MAG: ChbG/HpnK family deacetylase [Tahibacter sp.]
MTKILIVNADDFGLCAGVNAAIIDAYEAGSLSSTTLLVNGEASTAAARLAQCHPGLGVGLHFNLTLGRPSSAPDRVSSLLTRDGLFPHRNELARRLLLGRIRRDELARELAAQLAAFANLGLIPTHLDSHQHVHGFPPVFDALAEVCVERSLPLRQPWVAPFPISSAGVGRRLRTRVLNGMNVYNHRRWKKTLRNNAAFTSVFDFGKLPADLAVDHYRSLLREAGSPCELMVHLARDPGDVEGLTRIGETAHAEWTVLIRSDFSAMLTEQGWQLQSYREAFKQKED